MLQMSFKIRLRQAILDLDPALLRGSFRDVRASLSTVGGGLEGRVVVSVGDVVAAGYSLKVDVIRFSVLLFERWTPRMLFPTPLPLILPDSQSFS